MMSIEVVVSVNDIMAEVPVLFPEAPQIGDEINVLSLFPFQSTQRNHLKDLFEEKKLFGQGKVIGRFWSCKDSKGDPLLSITIDLEKKP